MDGNRTIEALEEEVKLLKGEMKQSLASVRDYLLNMELPSSEFATVLAALGGENDTKITLDGGFMNMPPPANNDETPEEEDEREDEAFPEETFEEEHELGPENEIPEEEGFTPDDPVQNDIMEDVPDSGSPFRSEEQIISDDGGSLSNDMPYGKQGGYAGEGTEDSLDDILNDADGEIPDDFLDDTLDADLYTGEDDDLLASEPELFTEEELPMEQVRVSSELEQSIPKVNLLANLIAWVARAKRDIGHDQIPALLEVYGISGHLSPELKEVILHLADITQEQKETSSAEIWSQTMSSLHGVLTGGDAPLYPLKPMWGEDEDLSLAEEEVEETEVEKANDQPVKLKLVFPGSDGKGKEFCIDLAPETVEE